MTTNSALLFALRPLEISPKVRQYPSRSSRNLAQALAELHLSPKAKASSTDNLALQKIAPLIHEIRGERVILDSDLARIYDVTTKRLNEQVRRNAGRFPEDFAFQLNQDEMANLMSQFATSR